MKCDLCGGNCTKPNYMILYNKNIKYCSKCAKKVYIIKKNFKLKYKDFRKMSEEILDNMMKVYEDETLRRLKVYDTEGENSRDSKSRNWISRNW